jgi:hypothetical protein
MMKSLSAEPLKVIRFFHTTFASIDLLLLFNPHRGSINQSSSIDASPTLRAKIILF